MNILAIESSCDETSVAVLCSEELKSNLVSSQDFHTLYGGVVPELSSRAHIQRLLPLVKQALAASNLELADIDYYAATAGPGLIGALLTGFTFSKTLAFSQDKPFIPINHVEGHIFSGFLQEEKPEFPLLVLAVSGGHTLMIIADSFTKMKIIGSTVDDAVGEAFDKVAKMLGLGYPGGPAIQNIAFEDTESELIFPIANLKDKNNFSFSGLKTSVLRYLQSHFQKESNGRFAMSDFEKGFVAGAFQKAAVGALMKNCGQVLKGQKVRSFSVVGGVAANKHLRQESKKLAARYGVKLVIPDLKYCGDNAGMIAFRAKSLIDSGLEGINLNCEPFPSFQSDYLI